MFVIPTVCVAKVIHYIYRKWVPVPTYVNTTSDEEERDTTRPFHELGTLPGRWIDTYSTDIATPELQRLQKKWCRNNYGDDLHHDNERSVAMPLNEDGAYCSADEDAVSSAEKLVAAFSYTEAVGGK